MLKFLLLPWLNLLIPMFFGIGMGATKGETKQAGEEGALAGFATSTGEKDIGASSNFWQSILSGDPSKIATVLGPQISGINKRAQQSKKTTSEFSNRGGGTNASMQMTDDNTRTSMDSLVSSLTGQAAGELGSMGSGLLSLGSSAHGETFNMEKVIHEQNMAKMNDLMKSIGQTVGAASMFVPGVGGAIMSAGAGVLQGDQGPGGQGDG